MNKEVARAHCETLIEWADLHKRDDLPGSGEAAYLLNRAARQIARTYDLIVPDLPPEPREREPAAEDVRDG